MFTGLSLGFSFARSGLLLSFPSLCFFCLFSLHIAGPYLCPVCPPVNTSPIRISCFPALFCCAFRYTAHPIHAHKGHLCLPKPHFRAATCPHINLHPYEPINTHHNMCGHPQPSMLAYHVAVHFAMFCYVFLSALACVFGVFACVVRGVSPLHMS